MVAILHLEYAMCPIFLTTKNIIDVHVKASTGMTTIDWSQVEHPRMNSQHNKNATTFHFDIYVSHILNHLQIAWLMCG